MNSIEWVTTHIDGLLDATGQISARYDAGWFHPSDLSDPCDASVAYAFLGYARAGDVDARIQRIFDLGHARDKAIKQYFADAGLSAVTSDAERKMEIADWRIRGECDDILTDPNDGEPWIAEIKTINQRGFDGVLPLASHIIQTHCYMKGHGIPRAFVLYENKNDCRHKVVPVLWDEDVWAAITQRIVHIISALRAGWPLERNCKYGCRYPERCRSQRPDENVLAIGQLGLGNNATS